MNWLALAKERIECVLHNHPDNRYLKDAIKFINEAEIEANDIGEDLGLTYSEIQKNDRQPFEKGFK